tara:strand:- start:4193 stop:4408 length:216 start_codon:yes stop_codon:yes gene_type:complete
MARGLGRVKQDRRHKDNLPPLMSAAGATIPRGGGGQNRSEERVERAAGIEPASSAWKTGDQTAILTALTKA